ncbi:hypothetical protein F2Q68_00039052 [Brassica cretica]|uniref:Uncharacterized protein n=1 Tax=Brassica cretica TaxID=69181 RepID=A0A8S9MJ61_BRACR|nr:hypothetical protein F2Q68_00039052 [Brassica cretica]
MTELMNSDERRGGGGGGVSAGSSPEGKKFSYKSQKNAQFTDDDLKLSDDDESVTWIKKDESGEAGDNFVTSVRGLSNTQRRKAKAFVIRTMRAEAENDFNGEWSDSDVEFSPFARQLTITKAKRLIRRHTKKFRPSSQRGLTSQQRESLPLSVKDLETDASESSSVPADSMVVRIRTGEGRSGRSAKYPSRTSCVPTWVKSSESLRILALEKWTREKSIMGSNTEARSLVPSSGCALGALDEKERLWYSQFSRPDVVPALAPLRTYAGRCGTRHDQSDRSCPPDQLQPQGVHDPRRTQLHHTSRTARDPTATAPVRIRAARDPIEAARVPASSRPSQLASRSCLSLRFILGGPVSTNN